MLGGHAVAGTMEALVLAVNERFHGTSNTMKWPSKIEWLVIAIVVLVVIALAPPTPHWRETTSESCHVCGNCRRIARTYRWWQLDSEVEVIEPTVVLPVPDGHKHDWWQYSSSYTSYNKKWASSRASRYRDGRQSWTP